MKVVLIGLLVLGSMSVLGQTLEKTRLNRIKNEKRMNDYFQRISHKLEAECWSEVRNATTENVLECKLEKVEDLWASVRRER